MRQFFTLLINSFSIFSVVGKRLRHQPGLSLSSLVGIVSVLGLVICVPIFTNAVLSQVLKEELTAKALSNRRSLFSLHAYYNDDITYTPVTFKNAQYVSTWVADRFERMGLAVRDVYLEMNTAPMNWKPIRVKSSVLPFQDIFLYIMGSDLAPRQTRLVEGEWPAEPDTLGSNFHGPLPVAVYEEYADEHFLNVGDIYRSEKFDIEIVGIFRAIDETDPGWFYSPSTVFDKEVWVPKSYFDQLLPALIDRPVNYVSWYAIIADESLRFTRSLSYTREMVRLEANFKAMLPDVKIDYSPVEQLTAYDKRLGSLLTLFYVIGSPLILLALIFISLTASIAVHQEEQETTTLRGRGVSFTQVYVLNLAESLVLLFISLPFAFALGWWAANLMSQTQLFLQFTRRPELVFSLQDIDYRWLAGVCVIVVLARLAPLVGLRHTTVVTVKQDRSRAVTRPVWQRFYLDILMLFLAGYAYWVLKGQASSWPLLASMKIKSGDGQYDPLMFIASALFTVGACLLALRLFPLVVRLVGILAHRFLRVGSYLAIEEIARRPQEHASVMLLIMISLGLAVYSTTMAKTLDRWLYDSQYYRAGADLVVREYEILSPPGLASLPAAQKTQADAAQRVESLVSLEKHLAVPGITSATLVGKYNGVAAYGTGRKEIVLMGIDRITFAETAYFRRDFIDEPLVGLMNLLADHPDGVLAPRSFLEEADLQVGDRLSATAQVGLIAEGFNADLVIVGAYAYFPTVYPADKPTFILSMDSLFGGIEAATNYDVWIKLNNQVNEQEVLDKLKGLAFREALVVDVLKNVPLQIRNSMDQPEWVGLFGILSVGFLLTGLMPCIGFVLNTFATLRKNYVQLGILQAIGLSVNQMISYLVLERLILMGFAMACGVVIGYCASVVFIPLLQAATTSGTPIPPFALLFGFSETLWLALAFSGVLIVAVAATIVYLMQVKIFQAVKLGETI